MIATHGDEQLRWLLPGVQEAERKLRAYAQSRGISYIIAPYGGLRTESIVNLLLRWRDEAVAKGQPSYRVSSFQAGKHPKGGAFDIRVTKYPLSMSIHDAYRVLGEYAPRIGLVWGGTFPPPEDIFHFESHQSLAQLETRFANWVKDPAYPQGYVDPWLLVGLALLGCVLLYFLIRR